MREYDARADQSLKLRGSVQETSQCTMRGSSTAVALTDRLAGGMPMWLPSARQPASLRSALWGSPTPTMMRPTGMSSMSTARSDLSQDSPYFRTATQLTPSLVPRTIVNRRLEFKRVQERVQTSFSSDSHYCRQYAWSQHRQRSSSYRCFQLQICQELG